ncbi:MAG: hypothetical protein ACH37Z_12955 [Anaerolineae bacterium]
MPALDGVDQIQLDENFQTLGLTDRFHYGLTRGEAVWLGVAQLQVETWGPSNERTLTATVPISIPAGTMAKLLTDLESMRLARSLSLPTATQSPDNYLNRTMMLRSGSSMVVGLSVVSGHGANHPWRVDLVGDSAWSADLRASKFWAGLEPFLAPKTRDELRRKALNLPPPTITVTPRPSRTRTPTARPTPEGGFRVGLPWAGR